MDRPTDEDLRTEYNACAHQVSRNEQAIWGSAGIFLAVNTVALASLLGRGRTGPFAEVIYVFLAMAAIAILILHHKLLSRHHFLNLTIYARELEIERQLKLRKGRYINALDAISKPGNKKLEERLTEYKKDLREKLTEQGFEGDELEEAVTSLNQRKLLESSGREPKGINLIQGLDKVLIALWALFALGQLLALLGRLLNWSWANSLFGIN